MPLRHYPHSLKFSMSNYNILNSLIVICWNANGVRGKILELRNFVKIHNPDIICLQETHLNSSSKLSIPGYIILRSDRLTRRGGGTAICIKNSIEHHLLQLNTVSFEHTSIALKIKGGHFVTVSSIYKPPLSKINTIELSNLTKLNDSFFICGDFNAKHPSWNQGSSNQDGTVLFNFAQNNFFQIIAPYTPTRVTQQHQSTIDLALVYGITHSHIESIAALSSDHNPLLFKIHNPSFIPPNVQTYKITNWKLFHEILHNKVPGNPHINNVHDIDITIANLTYTINNALNSASICKPKLSYQKTLPHQILIQIRYKNNIRKLWQRTLDPKLKTELNKLQRNIQKLMQDQRNRDWNDFLTTLDPEDNSLFKVNKKLTRKFQPVPPLKSPSGVVFTDIDKANLFGNTLEQTFICNSQLQDPIHDQLVHATVERYFTNLNVPSPPIITPNDINEIIKHLNAHKSPGPDNINNKMLKNIPLNVVTNIAKIINACFKFSHFPDKWKLATVIMIPKPSQDHKLPTNYRPISLLNSLAKIFEKTILFQIKDHCNSHNILPNEQFGFRNKHSTSHQLLRAVNTISAGFNNYMRTGAVFLDIARAFDKVWHTGLLYKLITLKFPPHLIFIIKSYLENRKFRVRVGSLLSDYFSIQAGTPQGALLSPILYNIYTHDIPNPPHIYLHLFADDTALLTQSKQTQTIINRLQKALNTIEKYCHTWKIAINTKKTQAMIFKRKRSHNNHPSQKLKFFNDPLPWQTSAKYLGVILDETLSYKQHVETLLDKHNKRIHTTYALINRNSQLSLKNKMLIYKTIIRPLLTYACPIWANTVKTRLTRLEATQSKTLRMITNSPWYIRNEFIRSDLKIPSLLTFIEKLASKFFNSISSHPNPLISIQDIHSTLNAKYPYPFQSTIVSQRLHPP